VFLRFSWNVNCELVLVKDLLTKLDFVLECLVRLYCDDQVVVHIVKNSVFHQQTKHVEVNCHLVRHEIEEKIV